MHQPDVVRSSGDVDAVVDLFRNPFSLLEIPQRLAVLAEVVEDQSEIVQRRDGVRTVAIELEDLRALFEIGERSIVCSLNQMYDAKLVERLRLPLAEADLLGTIQCILRTIMCFVIASLSAECDRFLM